MLQVNVGPIPWSHVATISYDTRSQHKSQVRHELYCLKLSNTSRAFEMLLLRDFN